MSNVIEVDAGSWEQEVLKNNTLVVVDFWHEKCTWCKLLEPIYDEIAAEHQEKAKFAKLNVMASQDNRRIAGKYGVMGTPTLVLFCNGRPVSSMSGFRPKEGLERLLDDALLRYRECGEKCTELI
ncbi:MAG: thioredoxin domain-containing protein [Candidatus Bathyarchaeota archaeon]